MPSGKHGKQKIAGMYMYMQFNKNYISIQEKTNASCVTLGTEMGSVKGILGSRRQNAFTAGEHRFL